MRVSLSLLLIVIIFSGCLCFRVKAQEVPDSAKIIYHKVVGIPIKDYNSWNKGNIYDPYQLVVGHEAGLSITRPGGDPNGAYNIRIRGLNTFSRENQPLVVLDGMVGIPLENIDPADIGSIEVLKETAATALYGMRGANGVIIVTSKEAKAGDPQISLTTSIATTQVAKTFDVLSASEFVAQGGDDFGGSIDWRDETLETGVSENINFSLRQKVGETSFGASVNYRDVEGILSRTNRKRLNSSVFISQSALNDKLKVSFRVSSTREQRGLVNPGVFEFISIFNPTGTVFDDVNSAEDGPYFQIPGFRQQNPVAWLNEQLMTEERKWLLSSYSLSYEINPVFKVSGNYTRNSISTLTGSHFSRNDWFIGAAREGMASRSAEDRLIETGDFYVDIDKEFNVDLKMNARVGIAFQNRTEESFSASASGFLFDSNTFNNLRAGANLAGFNGVFGFKIADRLNSHYLHADLNYKEALKGYLNIRADSYSGFVNDKTGVFYGIGIEYDLLNAIDADPLDKLSFRASYGVSGNLPPDPTLALPLFDTRVVNAPLGDFPPFFIEQLWNSNAALRWETTKELNLGVDFSLRHLGIYGSIDYFSRKSVDLIFQENAAIGSPNPFEPGQFLSSSRIFTNLADISSGGLELDLNYHSSKWSSSINLTFYDRPVLSQANSGLNNGIAGLPSFTSLVTGGLSNLVTRNLVGAPVGNLHAPQFLGANADGEPLVMPFNAFEEWGVAGNALPTTDIGFYNALDLGKWKISALIRGSLGHSIFNTYRWFYEGRGNSSFRIWNSVLTDKDPGVNGNPLSDLFIEKASFLRLNHLTVSRSFEFNNETRLTASITGQNLFTITSYTGLDPEVRYVSPALSNSLLQGSSAGIDATDLHFTTRTWTLAIRFDF